MTSLGKLALIGLAAASLSRADSLGEVLTRMDRAAKDFKSVTANVKTTNFTAVLNESDTSTGSLAMRRTKSGNEVLIKFSEPDPYEVHLGGHTVKKYSPRANTVEIYDTSKLSAAEKMMLLGFGVSAADLRKDYDMKLIGSENAGSVQTTRIELTPKSAEIRKYAAKIELWIPDGQVNPVQEKWTAPSKDYHLMQFSEVKVNEALPDSAFELKLPPGVKELHP
jgi:outer membrane lipoprotein-sorting protein